MRQIVLGVVVDGDAERTLTAAHSELATPAANSASMAAPTIDPAPGLTLLYGSQTGNTDGLEGTLASLDGERGMLPHRVSRADYRARDVGRERPLLR